MLESSHRRAFLARTAALGTAAFTPRALSEHAAAVPPDWCGPPEGTRLLVPGEDGWLGRLAPDESLIALATAAGATPDTPWPEAFAVRHRGRSYRNPTLAFESGQRARLVLANTLHEPTIVHWHGLQVDTANDGAGMTLVPPAGRYAYDFAVRARSGLYWYHPHPHGLSAGQTYRGLFGLIVVDDADDRALRAALGLVWGRTDIPLVLQDRRPGAAYAPSADDTHHGFLGDIATVNGDAGVAPRRRDPRVSLPDPERVERAHLPAGLRRRRREARSVHARRHRRRTARRAHPLPGMFPLVGRTRRRPARSLGVSAGRRRRAGVAGVRSDAFRGARIRGREAGGDGHAREGARAQPHPSLRRLSRGRRRVQPRCHGPKAHPADC